MLPDKELEEGRKKRWKEDEQCGMKKKWKLVGRRDGRRINIVT